MIERTYHIRDISNKTILIATCSRDYQNNLPREIERGISATGVKIVHQTNRHFAGMSICEVEINVVIPKVLIPVVSAYLPPCSSVHIRRSGYLVDVMESITHDEDGNAIQIKCSGDMFKGIFQAQNNFANFLTLGGETTKRGDSFPLLPSSILRGSISGMNEPNVGSTSHGKFFIVGIPSWKNK